MTCARETPGGNSTGGRLARRFTFSRINPCSFAQSCKRWRENFLPIRAVMQRSESTANASRTFLVLAPMRESGLV